MSRQTVVVYLIAVAAVLAAREKPAGPDPGAPANGPAVEVQEKIAPTGLQHPPGQPTAPGGVILRVQLRSAEKLLGDLDGLLVSFLPANILPPPFRPLLDQPHPALAILGAQTMGAPLTTTSLAQFTGLDSARPATLDLLLGAPAEAWILRLPVANFDLFNAAFSALARPASVEGVQLAGGRGYVVQTGNTDLPPKLVVIASDDTVYVCGSEHAAQSVYLASNAAPGPEAAFFSTVLSDYKDRDLVIAASPCVVQPFIPGLLAQAQGLPPMLFAALRQFVDRLPPLERARLEMRLRLRFGLPDVETCLAILEAFGYSGWEILLDAVATEARALDGVACALDLDKSHQSLLAAIYSKTITRESGVLELDMEAVAAALASLPGERMWASARGGRPSAPAPSVSKRLLQATVTRLQADDVDPKALVSLLTTMESLQTPDTLEQHVPWIAQAGLPQTQPEDTEEFASLVGYFAHLTAQARDASGAVVSMFPGQNADGVAKLHVQQSAARQHNEEAWARHLAGRDARWLRIEHRATTESAGDVTKVRIEKAWITLSGLFGVSQHEFINRTILSFRTIGDYTYMQKQLSVGDDRLTELPPASRPLPDSLGQLIADTPDGTHAVTVWRVLPSLLNVVNLLNEFESVAHRELDRYLADANAVWGDGGGPPGDEEAVEKVLERLEMVEMPYTVRALCADAEGQLYVVLPPALRYPRPHVTPLLAELLSDYASLADTVGGGAIYLARTDGKSEARMVLRSDGLAALVRTAVNKFAQTYLADPQGMAKLMQAVRNPRDGEYTAEEALVANPMWLFLDQVLR